MSIATTYDLDDLIGSENNGKQEGGILAHYFPHTEIGKSPFTDSMNDLQKNIIRPIRSFFEKKPKTKFIIQILVLPIVLFFLILNLLWPFVFLNRMFFEDKTPNWWDNAKGLGKGFILFVQALFSPFFVSIAFLLGFLLHTVQLSYKKLFLAIIIVIISESIYKMNYCKKRCKNAIYTYCVPGDDGEDPTFEHHPYKNMSRFILIASIPFFMKQDFL